MADVAVFLSIMALAGVVVCLVWLVMLHSGLAHLSFRVRQTGFRASTHEPAYDIPPMRGMNGHFEDWVQRAGGEHGTFYVRDDGFMVRRVDGGWRIVVPPDSEDHRVFDLQTVTYRTAETAMRALDTFHPVRGGGNGQDAST